MTDPQTAPAAEAAGLEHLSRCPVCACDTLELPPLQPTKPLGLLQCRDCGLVMLSPRPKSINYDDYADLQHSEEKQQLRALRHLAFLKRYAAKPGRLLDVGAGCGHFLKAARDAGWQVEGMDLCSKRVQFAKENFGIQLSQTIIEDAPFPGESFDAIAMFQLIEHVYDPAAVLKRAHGLLRTGGIVLISTPNVLAHSRKKRGIDRWGIPLHVFFFTPRTLAKAVEAAGFEILRPKFGRKIENALGWQPWPDAGALARLTRDLWTPFGVRVVARKRK